MTVRLFERSFNGGGGGVSDDGRAALGTEVNRTDMLVSPATRGRQVGTLAAVQPGGGAGPRGAENFCRVLTACKELVGFLETIVGKVIGIFQVERVRHYSPSVL